MSLSPVAALAEGRSRLFASALAVCRFGSAGSFFRGLLALGEVVWPRTTPICATSDPCRCLLWQRSQKVARGCSPVPSRSVGLARLVHFSAVYWPWAKWYGPGLRQYALQVTHVAVSCGSARRRSLAAVRQCPRGLSVWLGWFIFPRFIGLGRSGMARDY